MQRLGADLVISTTHLIGGLLGPTLIASAIAVIANLGAWPALVENAARNPALIMIARYIAFTPGLAIVYFHNRWTFGWPVTVTVMGCILLLGGFSQIVFPMQAPELGMRMLSAAPAIFPQSRSSCCWSAHSFSLSQRRTADAFAADFTSEPRPEDRPLAYPFPSSSPSRPSSNRRA